MMYLYLTTYDQLEAFVNHILEGEYPSLIGTDTEGTGLDPHTSLLRLIQLSISGQVTVIDCFKIPNYAYLIQKLIDATKDKTTWACHNWKYDLKMFWKSGVDFSRAKLFDTMLGVVVAEAGLPTQLDAGLKAVCERYLHMEVDKTEQRSDWSIENLTRDQLRYAAEDALVLEKLAPLILKKLRSLNLLEAFKLEIRALPAFAAMEYFGTTMSADRLEELRPHYEDLLVEAESHFLTYVPNRYTRNNLFGEEIDKGFEVSSPQQVLGILRQLDIPNPLYDPKSGDEKLSDPIITSTGSTTIKLLDIPDYPILDSLLQYRKCAKLLSAYIYSLPKLINPVTGRIHPHFNQCVSTGRASSSNPNLQNLPRASADDPFTLRRCFIVPDGKFFVGCDYSQIELRVIAEIIYQLTGDNTMLDEFLQGKDPYANTAALLSGMTYEEFVALEKTEYKKRRQSAKAVRLGYNYAMGYRKFRNYAKQTYGVSMTMKEAKQNRELYFSAYPGLIKYHEQFMKNDILEVRTLAPFNRARFFEEYPGVPALANHPVQGTSADVQKLAMALIYERLHDAGYSPTQSHDVMALLTIHDEIVLEAIEAKAEWAKTLLEDCMKDAAQVVLVYCPVEADAKLMTDLSQKD